MPILLCALALMLLPSWAAAFSFVAESAIDEAAGTPSDTASGTTIDVDKPTGTTQDDIMFALVKRLTANSWSTVPTGWTLLASDADANTTTTVDLYYRVAGASEGASYQWISSGTSRIGGSIYAFRSDFNTTTPIDVYSNTSYETNDTIVRGASMTTSVANEALIFFSLSHASSSQTFTPATVPTTFTEHTDTGSANSRFWRSAASVVWSGSGATGTMDAAVSAANTSKHAFVVALQPAAAGSTCKGALMLMGGGGC